MEEEEEEEGGTGGAIPLISNTILSATPSISTRAKTTTVTVTVTATVTVMECRLAIPSMFRYGISRQGYRRLRRTRGSPPIVDDYSGFSFLFVLFLLRKNKNGGVCGGYGGYYKYIYISIIYT